MSGFKVPRRTAHITFDQAHEYYGAEIDLNLDVPLRVLFEFQKLREDDSVTAFQLFADIVLASWNIEAEDGSLLPANYQGMSELPPAFVTSLIDRWIAEGTTAPTPLEQPSSDTDGSVVPLTKTGSE